MQKYTTVLESVRGVLDSWALCSVGGKEIGGKWNMKKMNKTLACLGGWQLTGPAGEDRD